MRDFISLTKPRIVSLLLVTTIAPMFVAGRPGWDLVLVVFIGGYLMAGDANAVNMYLDRDIDDRMSRTRLRPLPSGRMQPREVLACTLFDRPYRRLVDDLPLRYVGFTVPDEYFVGYGFDLEGRFRGLPDLRVVHRS